MIGASEFQNVKFKNVECKTDVGGRQAIARCVGHALQQAAAALKAAGLETPRLDARCLLGHVLNKNPADPLRVPGGCSFFRKFLPIQ